FVEVVVPCPVGFGRPNKIGEALDEMKYYKENSIVRHFSPPEEAELNFRGKIVVGKFVQQEKPSYLEIMGEVEKVAMKK
ncbi:MAG: 2-oxoacid:ferredoxin oxidoreductase subunit beta, partial [bacterium]